MKRVEQVAELEGNDQYLMTAVAGLVRCRSLLQSMLIHDIEQLHDLIGADLRLLLENCAFSFYILLATDDELDRLRRDELRRRELLARKTGFPLGFATRDPDGDDVLTIEQTFKSVSKWLADRGDRDLSQLFVYDGLYRVGSYMEAHPGLLPLGRYLSTRGDGQWEVSLIRAGDDDSSHRAIAIACRAVAHLAIEVFNTAGIDIEFPVTVLETIDELTERWWRTSPRQEA